MGGKSSKMLTIMDVNKKMVDGARQWMGQNKSLAIDVLKLKLNIHTTHTHTFTNIIIHRILHTNTLTQHPSITRHTHRNQQVVWICKTNSAKKVFATVWSQRPEIPPTQTIVQSLNSSLIFITIWYSLR